MTSFTDTRAETQRALRTMENTWWVQQAQEIQNLADGKNTQGFYDALKPLYGPRKRAIAQSDQLTGPCFSRTATRFLPVGQIILRVSSTTPTLLTHISWIICQACHQPSTWTPLHFTLNSGKPFQTRRIHPHAPSAPPDPKHLGTWDPPTGLEGC